MCKVSTVDSFEGQEADVVIFSAVSAPGYNNQIAASRSFTADKGRVTVALSRAKFMLVIFGDAKHFANQPHSSTKASLLQELAHFLNQRHALFHRKKQQLKLLELSQIRIRGCVKGAVCLKHLLCNIGVGDTPCNAIGDHCKRGEHVDVQEMRENKETFQALTIFKQEVNKYMSMMNNQFSQWAKSNMDLFESEN